MNVLLFLSLSDKAGIVDLISMIMNCIHVSKLVDTVDVGGRSIIGFLLTWGVSIFTVSSTPVELVEGTYLTAFLLPRIILFNIAKILLEKMNCPMISPEKESLIYPQRWIHEWCFTCGIVQICPWIWMNGTA